MLREPLAHKDRRLAALREHLLEPGTCARVDTPLCRVRRGERRRRRDAREGLTRVGHRAEVGRGPGRPAADRAAQCRVRRLLQQRHRRV
eukprot:5369039-Prymnesium_polylepis.1